MKKIIVILLFCLSAQNIVGQQIFMTRSGQISFFSKTPMENIEAINNEVNSMINFQTGDIVFAVLIKSFRFEKALMEEHFNENYMESGKIPKSIFQGKINNISSVDLKKDGNYPVIVEGDLTIHGVKQHIKEDGTLSVNSGKLSVVSVFTVFLKDYNIERPSLVAEKISEKIEVKLNCQYEPKS